MMMQSSVGCHGPLKLCDRLIKPATAGQGTAQAVVDPGVVRLDFQGLPIMCQRLVASALIGKGMTKVLVGLGEVGLNLQRLLIVCHRLIHPAPVG